MTNLGYADDDLMILWVFEVLGCFGAPIKIIFSREREREKKPVEDALGSFRKAFLWFNLYQPQDRAEVSISTRSQRYAALRMRLVYISLRGKDLTSLAPSSHFDARTAVLS